MPQYSYVLQKDLHFSDLHFIAKEGDIFVYTPPEQLVIYRSGEIAIQMGISKASIDGFCIAGIVRRYVPEPIVSEVPTELVAPVIPEPLAIVDPDPAPDSVLVQEEGDTPIKVEEASEETLEDLRAYIDESAPEVPVAEEGTPVVKPKRGGRRKATEDVKQG